jgi:tetratricopeptide (TPR) repeat protein
MPLDSTLAFAWCQNFCGLWDVEGAQKVLLQFIAEDSTDEISRFALATSYALTGQIDEAKSVLQPLPNSDPDNRALRVQLAVDKGDLEEAEKLVKEGPADHTRLNFFRGRLALQHNDPRSAAAYFEAALRKDPEDRDAIQGLGMALRLLGDPRFKDLLQYTFRHDELKRLIKDSVTTIQTDKKIFFKLGEICESLSRLDEARAWYRLAITRDPLDTQAQVRLTRLDQAVRSQTETPNTKPDGQNRSY